MINKAFSIKNISCGRNEHTLFTHLNFTIQEGELLRIQGENGVGKSTLLRCLAGLSSPKKGTITWCNEEIAESEGFKSQVLYLGHRNAIKSTLTAYENLFYTPALSKPCDQVITSALNQVGLDKQRDCLASSLSAGQKQRLALARLLLKKSTLWLLDEPFTALDRNGCSIIEDLLLKHSENKGMTIFTSHQPLLKDLKKLRSLELPSGKLD